ncbi:Acetylxylan esterase 1 [Colletotrichum truncatum]|uniref:Acetylxylan esterase 1 n=1 Tax=Colletotrichum truncatum TaxID=5467 RepID=A0ACC3YVK7_COLTU|nr:Acetylxylan esterase 1 [Colletotrichum truncatum]KAF6791306.1 Acetylxylan esterase 1 [Colletotrichum truncatum]
MKAKATTAAVAGIIASAAAQNSTNTCATGVHLIVARGSGEAPGSGRIGSVADGVVAAVPGSQIAPINYIATLSNYSTSVVDGTTAMKLALTEYNLRCPQSKVALLGYSQGAHVAGDILCGSVEEEEDDGLEIDFNTTSPIPSSVVDQSVIAVVLFGDPTHNASATWNRGTSTRNGLFPRENITACEQYAPKIESWCDTGDIYCDLGNDTTVHGSYFKTYTEDAVKFVVSQFNASKTNATSPTGTPTATPSSSVVPANGAGVTAPGAILSLAGLSMLAAYLM